MKRDNINHPNHYKGSKGIETIDFIENVLTKEEFIGYLRGNIIKYQSRANAKNNKVEDLKKAKWYSDKLIEVIENSKSVTSKDIISAIDDEEEFENYKVNWLEYEEGGFESLKKLLEEYKIDFDERRNVITFDFGLYFVEVWFKEGRYSIIQNGDVGCLNSEETMLRKIEIFLLKSTIENIEKKEEL